MRSVWVVAVTALTLMAAVLADAATVSGRVEFLTRRGQRPNRSETLVWLDGAKVKVPAAGSFRIATRSKTLLPHVIAVPLGSTVEFPNEDPIAHNLFSLSSPNQFDLGFYRRGTGKSWRFSQAGLVNVYCNVHPDMSAVIHVMKTPHYAFTDEQGGFSIGNIDAGTYRVYAWNEMGGLAETEVTVVEGQVAQAIVLTIDGRRYNPEQHLNKEGKPYSRSNRRDY